MATNPNFLMLSIFIFFMCSSMGCATASRNVADAVPAKTIEPRSVAPPDWKPIMVSFQSIDRRYGECHQKLDCAQLITSVIYSNWRRPPVSIETPVSYLITLDDDNNVVELKLTRSSGDFKYDKNAAVAIMSSSPFRELESLNSVDRNQQFHTFEVRFDVEDLR